MIRPKVIYDLFYLDNNLTNLSSQHYKWPILLENYFDESEGLFKEFSNILKNKLNQNDYNLYNLIFSEIITNAEKILKIVIESKVIKAKNYEIKYDKSTQPIFDIIFCEKCYLNETSIKKKLIINSISSNLKQYIFQKFRFYLFHFNLLLKKKNKRYDIHSYNDLVKEYFDTKKSNKIVIRGSNWLNNYKLKKNFAKFKGLDLFAQSLECILKKIISSDIQIKNAIKVFYLLTKPYLELINHNLILFEKTNPQYLLGDQLVGGSPKLLGRFLNHFYQKNRKKVKRFSHGGDRIFFRDKQWIFSELLYVDEYYCHSSYEAFIQNKKFKVDSKLIKSLSNIKFKSNGSLRHKSIWEKHKFIRKINVKKKILIIAGSFLGEKQMGSLQFKIPDLMLIEFLLFQYNLLKNNNYEVYIKPHPKGICKNIFKNKFKDIILFENDFLNPKICDFDCFIFEFAGSAFYDSLFTNKGIILFDTKIRPWYLESKKILLNRCQILETHQNKNNWLRFNKSEFENKLKLACDYKVCDSKFAQLLFK